MLRKQIELLSIGKVRERKKMRLAKDASYTFGVDVKGLQLVVCGCLVPWCRSRAIDVVVVLRKLGCKTRHSKVTQTPTDVSQNKNEVVKIFPAGSTAYPGGSTALAGSTA